ncbi:polysaccharide deacetylase family protein [Flavobacterium sp. XGLA_31]|uniref:polysaccharide deacetylase family protein n=1 Tax=Flavobacterium sp. XGLA_31 TaxID=3447666 RepID=UPI003F2B486F
MTKFSLPNTVVTYHDFVDVSKFEKQLQLLARRKDVLVTVDDGDLSFYDKAFPLLQQYKIPAVLFIIPSLIGTEKPFWWNEVYYYLGPKEASGVIKRLKSIPNTERINDLEKLRKNSDKPLLKQRQLTIDQLHEMQKFGVVIANHSFSHPMFDQCSESEIRNELQKTKVFFEENQLNGYEIFAYPNGSHNALSEKILKEEGIEYAFLFDHKLNQGSPNPLRISRLSVNETTPLWKFRFILSGWHSKIVPLTKMLHKILKG